MTDDPSISDSIVHDGVVLLLIEMCCRSAKQMLRSRMRNAANLTKVPLEEPYINKTIKFLNLLFSADSKSTDFWNNKFRLYIENKFSFSIQELFEILHCKYYNLKNF